MAIVILIFYSHGMHMSKNNPSLSTAFSYLPWWASALVGSLVFVLLKYVFPVLVVENRILSMMAMAAHKH